MPKLVRDENAQIFVLNFVIAGVSCAVTKTIIAPIDRIKLILQNQNSALQVLTGKTKKYNGLLDCFIRLPREQGLLSYWRGNGANLLRAVPSQALNFSYNDFFKFIFSKTIGDGSESRNALIAYISGGCAGGCSLFTVYPLKFCQTKIAVDMGSDKYSDNSQTKCVAREFNGITHCMIKVAKVDGILGLYKGFVLASLGASIYRAMYFGLFNSFKNQYAHKHETTKPPIFLEYIIAQSITVVAGLLTYPFDTVGRRLTLDAGREKNLRLFTNSWTAFRVMYVNEGFQTFFKGGLTNCIRGIGGALILVFYDEFLHHTKWKEKI